MALPLGCLPLGSLPLGYLPLGFLPLGFVLLGFFLHEPPFLVATSLKAGYHLAQMNGQRAGDVKQDVQMVRHQLPGNDGYLRVVVRDPIDFLQHGCTQFRRKEPWTIGGCRWLTGIANQHSQEGLSPLYRQRQHIDSRLAIVPVIQPTFIGWYRFFFLHASAKICILFHSDK